MKKINEYDIIGIGIVLLFLSYVFSTYNAYFISELNFYVSERIKTVIWYSFVIVYFFLPIKKYYRDSNMFRLFYYLAPIMILSNFLFAQYYVKLSFILDIIIVAIVLIYSINIVMLRNKNDKMSRIRKKIYARKALIFIVIIMMFPSIFMSNVLFKDPSYTGESNYSDPSLFDDNFELKEILTQNYHVLSNLEENKWKELTEKERVDVLATISDIERTYLGIEKEIKVISENLTYNTVGSYSDEEKLIRLNRKHLEDRNLILECIFHENFHVFQYKMISIIDENDINYKAGTYYGDIINWKNNEENYTVNIDEGYLVQPVEIAANQYSKEQMKVYLEFLEENSKESPK